MMRIHRLTGDPVLIRRRLLAPLGRFEFFALGMSVAWIGIALWIQGRIGFEPWDFTTYIQAGKGDLSLNYYAYWIMPLFQALTRIPAPFDFITWNLANILGIFTAARVFGGRAGTTLLTFQMLYILFLGQIIGILLGGLALFWWGLANKRWLLAGFGLLLASTKFQTGLTLGAFLFLLADISPAKIARVLLFPVLVIVLSLATYPGWPFDLWQTIQAAPPNEWGSITLWRWIGPYALLFWLPPLLLKLSKRNRFMALLAANALALPYFQQTDLLSLFVFPVNGLLKLLAYFPLTFPTLGLRALEWLVIVPFALYFSVVIPGFFEQLGAALMRRSDVLLEKNRE
jgi:hypothetical protein